jgi:hypothetical protein
MLPPRKSVMTGHLEQGHQHPENMQFKGAYTLITLASDEPMLWLIISQAVFSDARRQTVMNNARVQYVTLNR